MTDSPFDPRDPVVLVVDDEQTVLSGFELMLESAGIRNVICLSDSREVIPLLGTRAVSCAVLDLSMPHISGEALLPQIIERHPQVPVIIVTGHSEIDTAVRCMKLGAFDYLVKPVDDTRMVSAVHRATELASLRNEYSTFKEKVLSNSLENPEAFDGFVTVNAKVQRLFQYVETVARTDRAVLITGETGVGKELIARALHACSGRKGSFVPVNVAALDDALFSDTLFGHLKGAFTGAGTSRRGMVDAAADGTLFLDEIGDLQPSSQVKLLRLLQENEFYPLGADGARLSTARVVVATNKLLSQLQSSPEFRSDLYFRLETHHVHVPPLRERREDLPVLLDHFVEKAATEMGKKVPTTPKELPVLLASYHFPGNVRELEAMVYDAVSRHRARVMSLSTFKEHIARHRRSDDATVENRIARNGRRGSPFAFFAELPTLSEAQTLLIEEALDRARGNLTVAAQMLGITRSGLSKAIKRKKLVRE